jgi:hypothetical protein
MPTQCSSWAGPITAGYPFGLDLRSEGWAPKDELRARYGAAAYARVADEFDVRTVWRRLDAVYYEGPVSGRPIRVLFVVPNLRVGGAERHVTTLLPRMDPTRFTRSVVCISNEGELFADAARNHGRGEGTARPSSPGRPACTNLNIRPSRALMRDKPT